MSYQVLAQKYRPQTFDEVIGQEVVTRTLKNSILNGRIGNAYIFSGPRGVGKTSIARLLSKTLNCERPPEEAPCNKCPSCTEITTANSIDVLEIDGASNNGVDEIRALRENVKFSPSKGKYKIYIIDEVHMLSQGAFNALLKTLEEPPKHVKFIFATTEPHKVLPTILSRCQRFDFKRIPSMTIFNQITNIAKKEKINLDEKAALVIARSADGSLRDGLVILDQMVSFSGDKIEAADVTELLGMIQKDKIFDLAKALIGNDTKSVALTLDEIISNGKDPVFIATSLINYFRDLMIIKSTGSVTQDMAFSSDELERLKEEVQKVSIEEILYILQNLSHCMGLMKSSTSVRAPLEIVLIKLTKRGSILSIPELLSKIDNGDSLGGQKKNIKAQASNLENLSHLKGETSINPDEKNISLSVNTDNQDDPDYQPSGSEWNAVLNFIKNKKMSVYTFLKPAKPIEIRKEKIIIGFARDNAFNKEVLETAANVKLIEEACSKVTGTSPKIEFTLLEFLGETAEAKEEKKALKAKDSEEIKPVIDQAMDVFGGHVVRDIMEDPR